MAGLVPATHDLRVWHERRSPWMAGPSPAMTVGCHAARVSAPCIEGLPSMREIRAAVALTCVVSAAIRSGSIRAAGAETATQAHGRPA